MLYEKPIEKDLFLNEMETVVYPGFLLIKRGCLLT